MHDNLYHPSAYLVGRVAVRLVLPESNGVIDRDQERWSSAQIAQVEHATDAALRWWQARLPLAKLSFVRETSVVPSNYEPVNYALADEGLWLGDVLRALGYRQQNYFAQAFAAADELRHEHKADWALTIFIVNSANDADGRFADGRFAYAYIGGPFLVMTSDVGAYGIDGLAPVLAHEIGHAFGALDQYAAAQVPCHQRGGYLDVPTRNSRYGGCGGTEQSIMLDPVPAYTNNSVDQWALGQLGYRDGDGDNVIDVLDTTPTLDIAPAPSPLAAQQPHLRGIAADQPYTSPLGIGLSINKIERIEYRLDGEDWHIAGLNSLEKDGAFELTLPLYDGFYSVGLRAVNSIGAASPIVTRSLEVAGLGTMPTYHASLPPYVAGPTVTLTLSGPAAQFQIGESAVFDTTPWQPMRSQVSLRLASDIEGPRRLYVRFRDARGALSPVYTIDTVVDRTPPQGHVQRRSNGSLELQARDEGSGVASMQVRTAPQIADDWQSFQSNMTLPADATLLGVRYRDRAGNISPTYLLQGTSVTLPLVLR
jgi:hypothetical protein